MSPVVPCRCSIPGQYGISSSHRGGGESCWLKTLNVRRKSLCFWKFFLGWRIWASVGVFGKGGNTAATKRGDEADLQCVDMEPLHVFFTFNVCLQVLTWTRPLETRFNPCLFGRMFIAVVTWVLCQLRLVCEVFLWSFGILPPGCLGPYASHHISKLTSETVSLPLRPQHLAQFLVPER